MVIVGSMLSRGPRRGATPPTGPEWSSRSVPATVSSERRGRGPSTQAMPIPAVTPGPLFLDDAHLDFGSHVRMELDTDAELAQFADRLGEVHLALVDLDAELLELALEVARRDGAVQLVLLADLDGEGEADLSQARGLGFRGPLLGGALRSDPRALVGDLLLVGLGRRVGEPFWEEIVTRVAVLHLDDLPSRAEVLHALSQDHFHVRLPYQGFRTPPPWDRAARAKRVYTGQPSASSRTFGSNAGYRPGTTSITRRTTPLALRVASHCTSCQTAGPAAAGPSTAMPTAV